MGSETIATDREDWRRYAANGKTCSVVQAAALLGVSRWTVWAMIQDGRLYGWRLAGGRKYLLWDMQVRELLATAQSEAIRQARLAIGQMQLSLF